MTMIQESNEAPLTTTSRLTFSDAAWSVGVTPEAFELFVEITGLKHDSDRVGTKRVAVGELLRACFSLLGQKESQIAMLRIQLSSAIEREHQLTGVIKNQLLSATLSRNEDDEEKTLSKAPAPRPTPPPPPPPPPVAPITVAPVKTTVQAAPPASPVKAVAPVASSASTAMWDAKAKKKKGK